MSNDQQHPVNDSQCLLDEYLTYILQLLPGTQQASSAWWVISHWGRKGRGGRVGSWTSNRWLVIASCCRRFILCGKWWRPIVRLSTGFGIEVVPEWSTLTTWRDVWNWPFLPFLASNCHWTIRTTLQHDDLTTTKSITIQFTIVVVASYNHHFDQQYHKLINDFIIKWILL